MERPEVKLILGSHRLQDVRLRLRVPARAKEGMRQPEIQPEGIRSVRQQRPERLDPTISIRTLLPGQQTAHRQVGGNLLAAVMVELGGPVLRRPGGTHPPDRSRTGRRRDTRSASPPEERGGRPRRRRRRPRPRGRAGPGPCLLQGSRGTGTRTRRSIGLADLQQDRVPAGPQRDGYAVPVPPVPARFHAANPSNASRPFTQRRASSACRRIREAVRSRSA